MRGRSAPASANVPTTQIAQGGQGQVHSYTYISKEELQRHMTTADSTPDRKSDVGNFMAENCKLNQVEANQVNPTEAI